MSDETEVVEVVEMVELTPDELLEVSGGMHPDPFILGHH